MRLLARLTCLLACAVILLAMASATSADPLDDEARRIARQLQCPVCESVSVADSPADLAVQMRALIRKKLEAGESERQILEYFVAAYGEGVLTEPPRRGLGLLVWLAPVLALALGATLLWLVLRSWRRSAPPDPALQAAAPGRDGLAPAESPARPSALVLDPDDEYVQRAARELDELRRGIGK